MASLHISKDLENLIKKIALDSMHPVGSIYLSITSTNPGTFMGGTWVRVAEEKYLIGYNPSNPWFDKLGQSTGSNNETGKWNTNDTVLSVNQIPWHQHMTSNGEEGAILNWDNNTSATNYWGHEYHGGSFASSNAHSLKQLRTSGTGGSKGHNHFHVLPFYVVYVWKRTA